METIPLLTGRQIYDYLISKHKYMNDREGRTACLLYFRNPIDYVIVGRGDTENEAFGEAIDKLLEQYQYYTYKTIV